MQEVSMNQSLMDPKLIGLAAVAIVVIAVLAWMYVRKRRTSSAQLRQRFGPEYERRCERTGPNAEPKRSWQIVRSGSES